MIPATQQTPLVSALQKMGPHDHLCSIYGSQEEHLSVAIPFIRIGLDRGEKCIYIADDGTADIVREAMHAEGIDVERAIASKALVLTTKEQTYLKRGCFNPDWMFTFWKEATVSAMSEGFSALRATGETEWILRGALGSERWIEYEGRATHALSESNCLALCQYNRRFLPPELILEIIRTHPIVVYHGAVCRNLYYVPPDEFLGVHHAEREVERLLTHIREHERVESELREQHEALKRAHSALHKQEGKLKQARVTLHEQKEELQRGQEILVEDISRRKCAEALLSAEKHTLQMIAEGAVLRDVLDDLCRAIDEQSPGVVTMVSLIDPDGQHLRPAAGPHVPEGWRRTSPPTTIGPCAGSCGTAAFRKEPVLVHDIATDPLWANCRDVPMSYGLRACWSAPLVSTTGDVLGTFAMYYLEPHNPGEGDLTLMERAAQIARIAIERELVRKALRDSEQRFRLMVEGVKDYAIFMLDPEGRVTSWNAGAERIKGYREAEILGKHFSCLYPPEEVAKGKPEEGLRLATATGRFGEEGWRLRKDGTRFWADVVITAIRDEQGELIGFSKVTRDLTERKRAEAELRRKEAYLAEGQRLSHTGSWAWNVSSGELFWSQEHFRIFGLDPDKVTPSYPMILEWTHAEDRSFVQQTFESTVRERSDYALDCRIVRPDGTIRHIHSLACPVFNESGELTEYVGTIIDTTEHVQARAVLEQAFGEIHDLKERLHHENVALREEIDRTSMFEEIIGSSQAVKSVLSRVAKVAPMDSTVLITGETGTGKELIARAIHKRSKRAGRAFVAFNCAGIPSTLIASELFGHEKGAFTGAQQRRLGRFELAAGGTIFLDEIGELPAETQIALLRVLQEREFERVGGSQPISIDVRVITASNRDLQDAIAAGTFRLDLFHRLNVFPIEVPTLRERKEDIPMLLDYFIKRYAEKAGKTIRSIDKKTVEMFKSYSWPGNIRELQNVIERSMIVGESEVFSVDPSWLSTAPVQSNRSSSTLAEKLHDQEKKIIETSLGESKGRIAGRCGAAAKLGIPSSTLESKIKLLKINKNQFKAE